MRTLAKRATATAVRIMGMEAVSSQEADSGTCTKNSSRAGSRRRRRALSRSLIRDLSRSPGAPSDAARIGLRARNNERSIGSAITSGVSLISKESLQKTEADLKQHPNSSNHNISGARSNTHGGEATLKVIGDDDEWADLRPVAEP